MFYSRECIIIISVHVRYDLKQYQGLWWYPVEEDLYSTVLFHEPGARFYKDLFLCGYMPPNEGSLDARCWRSALIDGVISDFLIKDITTGQTAHARWNGEIFLRHKTAFIFRWHATGASTGICQGWSFDRTCFISPWHVIGPGLTSSWPLVWWIRAAVHTIPLEALALWLQDCHRPWHTSFWTKFVTMEVSGKQS